ncbi:general secretion pathway protein GspD [Rubripirellula amarantea]|nr:general secretion pathway protein GspD [Rubripirellula amarantea]
MVHQRHVVLGILAISVWMIPDLASAQSPASTAQIQKIQVPPQEASEIATRMGLLYRDVSGVQISSDSRNGQLIVMAPPSLHAKIADDVRTWMQSDARKRAASNQSDDYVHLLRNITAAQFETQFKQITSAPPAVTRSRSGEQAVFRLSSGMLIGSTVQVDRQVGTVTVIASVSKMEGWKKLIAMMDASVSKPNETTSLLRLHNAEPAPIQRAIRLITEMNQRNRRAESNVKRSPFQNAVFQQDAAGGQAEPDNGNGDAGQPADGETPEGGAGLIGDTQIEFVPELGTIIIKGAERDVQRVMEVIKQIEAQSEVTKPDVEVVQLQHADSNAVATLLSQLYEDVLAARQGSVSITSLDEPNALLLIGRTEAIKSLLELIQKIDQPIADENRLRVFRLQHASALDAEQTIRDFFTDRPGEGDDIRPGLGTRVRILADYRTNSLIISASPRDLSEVEKLINNLDVQEIASQSQIKVFQLNNALAEDLAPVIQDAINGEGEGDDTNQTAPSTTLSIVTLDPNGSNILDSGILSGAVVTADTGANAIVVRAPTASMALIGELIRQLDRAPGIDSLVKVFTIENGDALQLTTALQDLFGQDASTAGTSVGAGNLAGLPSSTAGADSSLVPLRFSTDQRTNSIVASGSAEDLEVVESILLRLDSQGFAERITEVIWLRHQAAADVAAALQAYVQQRTQTVNTIQQFQQGLGPFDLPDRDLIVVAEPVTNSVLLSVAPRLYEDVRRLIDRLDRRPPMVMIKVVLAEVALGDTFEVGGEVGLQDALVYDRGIAADSFGPAPSVPGFNYNGSSPSFTTTNPGNGYRSGNVAGRGVSNFGVGTTNSALGYGGLVLSAASDSVSLLLRTLQEANRLQVLSRPHVMTVDNTEAAVQVGRQVARIRDVTQNVQGTLVSTEDIQVGLILRIRPRVGADGLIVMDVDAERSQRDQNNGTPIPAGDGTVVIVDDIVTTNAQSTVAAFSGQTVVFGGLIQKTRSNFSRRVPIIADIPIIGNLFKYDQETEDRSELLIFLTPMLVTGEEDLEYVKQVESSRMSWCLADVVEMHGDVGLSGGYGLWGPATGGTIYPDMQPTVDDIIIHDDYSVDSYSVDPQTMQSYPQGTYPQGTHPQGSYPQGMPSIPGGSYYPEVAPSIQSPPYQAPTMDLPAPNAPMVPALPIERSEVRVPSQQFSPQASNSVQQPSAVLDSIKLSEPNLQVSWQDMIGAPSDATSLPSYALPATSTATKPSRMPTSTSK